MPLPQIFDVVTEGIGIGFEHIVFIICLLGCALFFVDDMRIGLLMMFLTTGMFFILFYLLEVSYNYALTGFMASFVLLALSLFILRLKEEKFIV